MKEIPGTLKVRVLLAQALFGNPDILLLDEPTNGLDIETIGWLENFLTDYENIVLVVSHDRHFLDSVCTHVADVDKRKIKSIHGQLHFLVRKFPVDRPAVDRQEQENGRQTPGVARFYCTFLGERIEEQTGYFERKKALEKLNIEEIEPSNRKYQVLFFQPLREVGNQILNVENLSKNVDGRKLFDKLSFSIHKGEKIAFLSKDPLAVTVFSKLSTTI